MLIRAFVACLHFLAVFGIVATVFYEWLSVSKTPTHTQARRLQQCDMAYGVSAALLLIVGFLRVFYFEKGSAYYFSNVFFWTKLALFVLVGLLSIYPTVLFLSWRKDMRAGAAPLVTEKQFATAKIALGLELALLVGIVLCASLMAKGLGA